MSETRLALATNDNLQRVNHRSWGIVVVKRLCHETGRHRAKAASELSILRELQACQHADHVGFARMLQCVTAPSGGTAVVMQNYACDLLSKICEQPAHRLPMDTLKSIFRQISSTLAHLHEHHHIAHLDVSAENVLIEEGPSGCRARLADFGDARRGDSATAVCGKSGYMAPEVYQCLFVQHHRCGEEKAPTAPYDTFSADVWSSGGLLFIMVLGFPAYDKPIDTDFGYSQMCTHGSAHLVSSYARACNENIDDECVERIQCMHRLIDAMMRKSPSARLCMNQVARHECLQ